jgi:hypothetical protein
MGVVMEMGTAMVMAMGMEMATEMEDMEVLLQRQMITIRMEPVMEIVMAAFQSPHLLLQLLEAPSLDRLQEWRLRPMQKSGLDRRWST